MVTTEKGLFDSNYHVIVLEPGSDTPTVVKNDQRWYAVEDARRLLKAGYQVIGFEMWNKGLDANKNRVTPAYIEDTTAMAQFLEKTKAAEPAKSLSIAAQNALTDLLGAAKMARTAASRGNVTEAMIFQLVQSAFTTLKELDVQPAIIDAELQRTYGLVVRAPRREQNQ